MHKIEIAQHILDRVAARRGGTTLFKELQGRKTALVVIDLQNAFMLPGMVGEITYAREIVPNVNALAEAVRRAGGKVVWVQMKIETAGEGAWTVYLEHMSGPVFRDAEIAALTPGSHGHALHDDLDVRDGDMVIEKTRFSAFIQGSCDLDSRLREAGIDTVIITGTVTNTCCESTARDAMMLNYKTIFVSDANACRTDEEHNTTLGNILRIFGDVASTQEVIGRLKQAGGGEFR
jgi:ureidoacrylate peracid hydrolase